MTILYWIIGAILFWLPFAIFIAIRCRGVGDPLGINSQIRKSANRVSLAFLIIFLIEVIHILSQHLSWHS